MPGARGAGFEVGKRLSPVTDEQWLVWATPYKLAGSGCGKTLAEGS